MIEIRDITDFSEYLKSLLIQNEIDGLKFVSEKVVLNKDVVKDVTKDVTKELSESQILLLKRISETGQWKALENVLENVLETSSTLAAYFGVNPRTIRRDISVLQAKGVIKHDGPDKGGRWIIMAYSKIETD